MWYVRSDHPTFMPRAICWGGHHDRRGYEQRERDICVFMDISQIGKKDSSIVS